MRAFDPEAAKKAGFVVGLTVVLLTFVAGLSEVSSWLQRAGIMSRDASMIARLVVVLFIAGVSTYFMERNP